MTERLLWLMAGSNVADKASRIDKIISAVSQALHVVAIADITDTPDVTGRGDNYLNAVMLCSSDAPRSAINDTLKEIELSLGRDFADRVNIAADIDIVVDDTEIVKPKEWLTDAFRQGAAQIEASRG